MIHFFKYRNQFQILTHKEKWIVDITVCSGREFSSFHEGEDNIATLKGMHS